MRIVCFSWKDTTHPDAGGAEFVTMEWLKRLRQEGHVVSWVTARYAGASETADIHGISVFRTGNRLTHYPLSVIHYLWNIRGNVDLLIEEVNTIPYMLSLFAKER